MAIESKDSRLHCYDRVAGDGDKEEPTDLGESLIHRDGRACPVLSSDVRKQDSAPEIHSRWASISKNARGYTLPGLENQQVWCLKEKSAFRFKQGQQVKIVEGFLGSTAMVDVASKKRFKVKRER